MNDFALLAVKAAALRKTANGVRAGETGLGVPGFGTGPVASPLTAADHAALASPEAMAANRYAGTGGGASGLMMGSKPGGGAMLARLMKSRAARLAAGTGAAGAVGYGLFRGGSQPQPGAQESSFAPQQEAPPTAMAPPAPTNARTAVRHRTLGQLGNAVKSWWQRMGDRYGIGTRG